jgi:peptidoglycan/LPS O-acetylase OafA/YrhL
MIVDGQRLTRSGAQQAPGQEPSLPYRRDIDGLRAIAVTSVVLFHAGVWPLRSGYVGVDIFFVISGFLIGGIIYRDAAKGRFSFTTFYARRARRILPALFSVIFASLTAGLFLLSPAELRRLGVSAGSALAAASNLRFSLYTYYFSPDAHLDPMLMTWSLGVEEQFYFIFPFVLLALRRFSAPSNFVALLALSLVSLAFSVMATAKAPTAAFYLLPTRGWELGAGALLAIRQAQVGRCLSNVAAQAISVVGLGVIVTSLVVFDEYTPFPGASALLPVLGTVAVIASDGSPLNVTILGHRIPVAIGKISYSWYLWHWPLMTFTRICSFGSPSVPVLLLIALISLLIAVVSWRFVEQPFRRPAIPDSSAIFRYALMAAMLMLVPVRLWLTNGLPQRFPSHVAQMENAAIDWQKHQPCIAPYEAVAPNSSLECISVDPSQPAIAIIGDSHAGALGWGVRELARQRGWGFEVLAMAACRPLRGVTVWRRDHPNFMKNCSSFMDAAFARVTHDTSVHAVILAGFWAPPLLLDPKEEKYYDLRRPDGGEAGASLLAKGLNQAVSELTDAGKQVFVAEDVPAWIFDPVRIAIVQEMPYRNSIQSALEPGLISKNGIGAVAFHSPAIDRLVLDAATDAGARYLMLASTFCTGEVCHYQDGRDLLYADGSHLSPQGAIRALSPWVGLLFTQNVQYSIH